MKKLWLRFRAWMDRLLGVSQTVYLVAKYHEFDHGSGFGIWQFDTYEQAQMWAAQFYGDDSVKLHYSTTELLKV